VGDHSAAPLINQDGSKPQILLMGLQKSGKSSIQKVVFQKMSPNETLHLESTPKIIKNDISNSSFVQFQIWDFPGQIDFCDNSIDTELIFGGCGALVFVVDSQEEYSDAIERLTQTIAKAHSANSNISFEVFIHKVDGFTDDESRTEVQRSIKKQVQDDLIDANLSNAHVSYHLTSIYDHSIFEAFSKVIQKLIPQLPTLERLLNILVSNSKLEKAFLIDVVSKIYVATDGSVVDMQYELASDMIDVVIDISCIYGMPEDQEGLAYDDKSQSIIKLNNGLVLYLREVNKYLALVALIKQENFNKHGVIDYNFNIFRKSVADVFSKKI